MHFGLFCQQTLQCEIIRNLWQQSPKCREIFSSGHEWDTHRKSFSSLGSFSRKNRWGCCERRQRCWCWPLTGCSWSCCGLWCWFHPTLPRRWSLSLGGLLGGASITLIDGWWCRSRWRPRPAGRRCWVTIQSKNNFAWLLEWKNSMRFQWGSTWAANGAALHSIWRVPNIGNLRAELKWLLKFEFKPKIFNWKVSLVSDQPAWLPVLSEMTWKSEGEKRGRHLGLYT